MWWDVWHDPERTWHEWMDDTGLSVIVYILLPAIVIPVAIYVLVEWFKG